MNLDLNWVHVARYELILRQDGAVWLRIISGPSHDPRSELDARSGEPISTLDLAIWQSASNP